MLGGFKRITGTVLPIGANLRTRFIKGNAAGGHEWVMNGNDDKGDFSGKLKSLFGVDTFIGFCYKITKRSTQNPPFRLCLVGGMYNT